ncbi:MAG: hypothetical protein KU37_04870 [Sulfuricurvum sp. PC08-66]|nr:MAG: hypothetical protein KU37_04870 [Sulfuricurvum sp. PC08-66]
MQSFFTTSHDNTRLFCRIDEVSNAKAVVLFIHGISEHLGRYDAWAARFGAIGYHVVRWDLRGHGKSDGARGYAKNYEALLGDIAHMIALTQMRFTALPILLYGHSLGANIALSYSYAHPHTHSALIVTSPFFRTAYRLSWWKRLFGPLLRLLLPNLRVRNEINYMHLTHDIPTLLALRDDRLVHRMIGVEIGLALQEAGEKLLNLQGAWGVPLLVLHSRNDHITSFEASEQFCAHRGEETRFIAYDKLYHELHFEPERDQVWADISAWLGEVIH